MLKYKNFSLIKPAQEQLAKISEVIHEDGGAIFHEVSFNTILEKYLKTDLYYLVDNPNNIETLSPVHITKNKLGFKRYNCYPLADIPYAGFVGKVLFNTNSLSVGFFESIKYNGFPYIKNGLTNNSLETDSYGETCMVNLSADEDDIFNNVIHAKRRNMIRKAIKAGITVKVYDHSDGMKHFWPILEKLHEKLGISLGFDFYNEIFTTYTKASQAYILVAFKDDKPISGVFVLGNKNYFHYYKGASSFEVKNEGQGELLQWEAIKLAKSLGISFYDLCNLEKEKLPAIYRFKTGISKEIIHYPKFVKNNLGYKISSRF